MSDTVEKNDETDLKRRNFLKLSSVSGAAGLMSGAGIIASTKVGAADEAVTMQEHDDFPIPISENYQPFHQKNTEFGRFIRNREKISLRKTIDENTPGMGRLDMALANGAWHMQREIAGNTSRTGFDTGLTTWKRKPKGEPYQFDTKQQAADAIKRAATLYGAQVVGITRQDPRWDYATLYDAFKDETRTWDDFPFKAKTVIVLGFGMDYEAHSAAPTYVSDATCGEGYNKMVYTGYQLAGFLHNLGYNAVASGNDLGMSIPYAVAAGLGEGSRMGILVNYSLGPRIRLAKVYTDIDFVEYDKPKTFGVRNFCKLCQRCADACPANSISKDVEPSMYPPEGHDHEPHAVGVEKWYCDTRSCLLYWGESNTSCGACLTACPYNKPNFWHHRLIEKMNEIMPGETHRFMREMDILFGYGDTFDPDAPNKFWSGKGRKYDGHN